MGFLRRRGPRYGAVGRRESRCMRLGVPLARTIAPFMFLLSHRGGIVPAVRRRSLRRSRWPSEKTSHEGSLPVRRFVR